MLSIECTIKRRRAHVLLQADGARRYGRRNQRLITVHQYIVDVFASRTEVDVQLVVQNGELVIEVFREGIERIAPDADAPVAVAQQPVVGQRAGYAARCVQANQVVNGGAVGNTVEQGRHGRLIVVLPDTVVHAADGE